MKLLAKTAEDRYQSALGLKADLEACLSMLQESGEISHFIVGQMDLHSQFSSRKNLWSRTRSCHSNGCLWASQPWGDRDDASERLFRDWEILPVNEVHKPIVSSAGLFYFCKFDQFKEYSLCFDSSIPGIDAAAAYGKCWQIAVWQAKLLAAFGANGQVIIDVIPKSNELLALSQLCLNSTESQNRFNRVFQHLCV